MEIVGPTLGILAKQSNVSLSGISTILMARSVGYMFANIAGALVQNVVKKYCEGLLAISFLIASIGLFQVEKNFHSIKINFFSCCCHTSDL